jgi:hypothetical protein
MDGGGHILMGFTTALTEQALNLKTYTLNPKVKPCSPNRQRGEHAFTPKSDRL